MRDAEGSADGSDAGGVNDRRGVDDGAPAYVAYWRGYGLPHLYVFSRVVRDSIDLGHALRALERDLGVNVKHWHASDELLSTAWRASESATADGDGGGSVDGGDASDDDRAQTTVRPRRGGVRGRWIPATGEGLKRIIREEPAGDMEDECPLSQPHLRAAGAA